MIQRPGNCHRCGNWTPFHSSWFSPNDKEVADPKYFQPWSLELWGPKVWEALKKGIHVTIQHFDGLWVLHLTKTGKTVESWPISILLTGRPPAERVGKTWRQNNRWEIITSKK